MVVTLTPVCPMNLAIRQSAPQTLDHRPAVGHRLQFSRGAQVAQEGAAFLDAAQRDDGRDQVALGQGFLAADSCRWDSLRGVIRRAAAEGILSGEA